MKVGDLVRWTNSQRPYLLNNLGLVLKLEAVSSNPGAWVHWLASEYGPQKAWTPSQCIEVVRDEV